jgi:hypothetical protein
VRDAGAGAFRSASALGFGRAHDSTRVHIDAPAAKHMVWGQHSKTKRRAAVKNPQPQKTHLDLLKEGASRLARVGFGHPLITRTWEQTWWVWSFDCALFVQAVLLYAVVKKLGKESFDKRVASHKPTQGRMVLRSHGSTGLTYKDPGGWQKEKPGPGTPPWDRERTAAVMKEQENNFKNAPNGSQIVFTNLDPRSNGRVYEHENAIKLGPISSSHME